MIDNLITFFLNFRYFKEYLFNEIKKKTAERKIADKINKFVVKTDILNTKSNSELLKKYKTICEKK
jgi:hypothetical protein